MATATSKLNIIIDVIGDKAQSGLKGITGSLAKLGVATAALAGAAATAKKAWDFAKEGAQLQLVEQQFRNTAQAAGYLSDTLLGKMRDATKGMVTDAELMQSGLDIMRLGLADSEDGVIRLATVVSNLGLDMQQVILTFANNSEMRLDALGLSVEGVRKRVEELNATGFEGDAFDEAVLLGLEEAYATLGDTSETAAGQIAMLETEVQNLKDSAKGFWASVAGPIVEGLNDTIDAQRQWREAIESGAISTERAVALNDALMRGYITQEQQYELVSAAIQYQEQQLNNLNSEVEDADRLIFQYGQSSLTATGASNALAQATFNVRDVTAGYNPVLEQNTADFIANNAALAENARHWSEIDTNIGSTIDRLQDIIEFTAGGGGALQDLVNAAERAMDEEMWGTASVLLDQAKQDSILFDQELGNIDAEEAKQQLIEMGVPIETAKQLVADVQQGLWTLTSQDYTVIIDVVERRTTVGGGDSPPIELIPSGRGGESEYASGTGGWLTVPGSVGQPYPVTLHGGEKFNVIPTGGREGSGNVVNWYGDAIFTTAGEAMSFLARMQSNAARNAASAAAGGGYIG